MYFIKTNDTSSNRSTYNPVVWMNSVRAVGSFGSVTMWWTEPYLDADYYAIYRRSLGSSRFFFQKYLTNPDYYYANYYVSSGNYYDYQATVYYDNGGGYGSYYMNAFRYNIYVP